jgi:hypothetical protein
VHLIAMRGGVVVRVASEVAVGVEKAHGLSSGGARNGAGQRADDVLDVLLFDDQGWR